ncbi:RNA polymerase sigma factor [Spirosoma fluviale]|uniref:RNA polymerase sigma factor n=1 Tax=Spirosoma fluviale TaxID=1597977 RepID=UPI0015C89393|nr:sigma-70 family RNA polymerase sigma factor [Spirosoma fluviale]
MNTSDTPKVDTLFINGLRTGDAVLLKEIYSRFFSGIKQMIQTNAGSLDDAKDIFQDALMIIYRQALRPDFTLTVAFYTYLYSVCRKLWLKQLRNRSTKGEVEITETMDIMEEGLLEAITRNEQYKLYQDNFRKLGDDCQKLLRLFMEDRSVKELMALLGYSSESYTKKRKFQCKEKLISLIKEDSRYRDLY